MGLCLSRPGRAAVVWGLASFATLQLGLAVALEGPLLRLRDPGYGFKVARLRDRLAAHPEGGTGRRTRLVVMLGSSHVADGLRGQLIEEELTRALGAAVIVFNLGNPADGPLTALLNLERLLEAGIRPDLLLVEFLPAYLCEHATNHLLESPSHRIGWRDRAILQREGFPVERLARARWSYWLVPWASHQQEMLSVVWPGLLPEYLRVDQARACDESGWVAPWYQPTEVNRARATRLALENYAYLKHFHLGNPFCPLYRATLARCRQERVPAALVLMPESSAFRALYAPDAWSQLDALLAELGREFGVPVIRARDWVGDEGFYDGHHLLPEGAAVFTRRLSRDTIAPLLAQSTSPPGPD
jgi:hypothetical protein